MDFKLAVKAKQKCMYYVLTAFVIIKVIALFGICVNIKQSIWDKKSTDASLSMWFHEEINYADSMKKYPLWKKKPTLENTKTPRRGTLSN